MRTISINADTEKYWLPLKDLSKEVKLWLINRLSASLIESAENVESEDNLTEDFINQFAGKWKSDSTPEQIIQMIEENRSCKPPINI